MTSLSDLINCGGLGSCLQALYNLGVQIAVALAFLMIILGGFEYMLSATVAGKARGKERIMDALKGLIIIFISGSVLYYINPNIFNAVLTIPQINITGEPGQEPQSTDQQQSGTNEMCGQEQCIDSSQCIKDSPSAVQVFSGNILINKNFCNQLKNLGNELYQNQLKVNLIIGKSSNRENPCHTQNGTCLDLTLISPNDKNGWERLIQSLKTFGVFFISASDCNEWSNLGFEISSDTNNCQQSAICRVKINNSFLCVYKFKYTSGKSIHLMLGGGLTISE